MEACSTTMVGCIDVGTSRQQYTDALDISVARVFAKLIRGGGLVKVHVCIELNQTTGYRVRPFPYCYSQWCDAIVILGINVGADFDETICHLHIPDPCGGVQARALFFVSRIHAAADAYHKLEPLKVAVANSLAKLLTHLLLLVLQFAAKLVEFHSQLFVAFTNCVRKWRATQHVHAVDVRVSFDQRMHNLPMPLAGGEVQAAAVVVIRRIRVALSPQ
mmetsp:Transcript_3480/g.8786  ORF Transcript_3480/g.8786 Transcript_3480/m.8786 type:complete len:218 (-) Transcript_3480:2338-2991(-)